MADAVRAAQLLPAAVSRGDILFIYAAEAGGRDAALGSRFEGRDEENRLAGAALLLWGCPQEEKEVQVGFDAEGRPVFAREEGTDCLSRLSVSQIDGSGERKVLWEAAAPMPMPTQPPCPISFPLTYGDAPGAASALPQPAPPLERGRRYLFEGEGNARYHREFQLP